MKVQLSPINNLCELATLPICRRVKSEPFVNDHIEVTMIHHEVIVQLAAFLLNRFFEISAKASLNSLLLSKTIEEEAESGARCLKSGTYIRQ